MKNIIWSGGDYLLEEKIPGGYILLSRNIIESDIFNKPPLYLKVWIYLLERAQFKEYKKLKRGQLFTSIPAIMEACHHMVGNRKEIPSKSRVRSAVNWLKNPVSVMNPTAQPMIETVKATHGMLVTILNYDRYQTPVNYEYEDAEAVNHREWQEQKQAKQEKLLPVEPLNQKTSRLRDFYYKVFEKELRSYQEIELNNYLKLGMTVPVLQEAFVQTSNNNSESFNYIKRILDAWRDYGVKTLKDIEAANERFRLEYRKSNGS